MITPLTKSAVFSNSLKPVEESSPVKPVATRAEAPTTPRPAQVPAPTSEAKDEDKQAAGNQVAERHADEVVQGLNEFAQRIHRKLEFSVDTDSGMTVIKVLNRDTNELVRQIPAESILTLHQHLNDLQRDLYDGELPGLLFKAEA